MEELCIRCKGKGLCGRPCKILSKISFPKIKNHFSGSAPPEIFVGRFNYPQVFSGILSPNQFGDTEKFSLPEEWVKSNLSIEEVLSYRGQMIYARHQGHIKSMHSRTFKDALQSLALSSKPVSSEFFLKKSPRFEFSASRYFSIMANPAPVEKVIIEENLKVPQKVDYLVSDYDLRASEALKELYNHKIINSHLNKLLSAGLLGVKMQRKMVPTRWAITAVDDILGKNLLEKIKHHQEISQIQIFTSEYNGNHYEFLLLPGEWSFEVIESWETPSGISLSQDYEGIFNRKKYASSVTGAYYANRLAVAEYLEKIRRQASVLVLRHISDKYYAPLGVGILREVSRKAFSQTPEFASSIAEAVEKIKQRLPQVPTLVEKSWLIKIHSTQKRLSKWF